MTDDPFYTRDELFHLGFRQVGQDVRVSRKGSFHDFVGTIGDHSRIDDFTFFEGAVEIGKYVHISSFGMISGVGGRVTLADCSTLSSSVSVYTQMDDDQAPVLNNPTVSEQYRNIIRGDVSIGVGCLVGAHSVVRPGSHLADGASVGALGLVEGRIAEGEVVVYGGAAGLRVGGMRDAARIRQLRDQLVEGARQDPS